MKVLKSKSHDTLSTYLSPNFINKYFKVYAATPVLCINILLSYAHFNLDTFRFPTARWLVATTRTAPSSGSTLAAWTYSTSPRASGTAPSAFLRTRKRADSDMNTYVKNILVKTLMSRTLLWRTHKWCCKLPSVQCTPVVIIIMLRQAAIVWYLLSSIQFNAFLLFW